MSFSRIQVSLPPDDYALIQDLATLQGRPSSKLVAEIVHLVLPHLKRQRDSMREAFATPGVITSDLERASSRAAAATTQAIALVMAGQSPLPHFDGESGTADDPRADGGGGGPQRDPVALAPLPNNMGATNPKASTGKPQNTPPKRKSKGRR